MGKHHDWVAPVSGTREALNAWAVKRVEQDRLRFVTKMATLESTLARCEVLADQLGAPAGGIADGDRVTF